MPVALCLLAFVAALLATFPFLLYRSTLGWLPARPLSRRSAPLPSATLLFCAYNEEQVIPAKLANLRAIRAVCPSIKFRCFVDASTDGTARLLHAGEDILHVHQAATRSGKAAGMAELVAACDSDVVIFTDANVLLDPPSVPRLLAYFADPEVGGVCGTLHYTNADDSVAARTSSAYWRLEERIKAAETRSGSTMGADGSIFAVRRRLYPDVPRHLLDDFIVSMSVVIGGYRLISVPDVHAFERAAITAADEFRRRRRIGCRAYLSHRHLQPRLRLLRPVDRYKYLGHKLLRWYSGWLLGLSALCGGWAMLLLLGRWTAPLLGAAALAAWLVEHGRGRHAAALREVACQFTASALGMADAWAGRTYQIWTPPARTGEPRRLAPVERRREARRVP